MENKTPIIILAILYTLVSDVSSLTIEGNRLSALHMNSAIDNSFETSFLKEDTVVEKITASKTSMYHSAHLKVLSQIMGWIYFLAWAVCFYPQIYENWRRKSVTGYNFDFLTFDTLDLSLYSAYNIGLYALPLIQDEYKEEHNTEVIPVKINDLIFGLHGVCACIVLIAQCLTYEKGGQIVSRTCKTIVGGIFLFAFCVMVSTLVNALQWIDFLTYLSYVKIFTVVKYVPQAYMNFKRKSTQGFSIGLVLCDATGGIFSIGQMIVNSYNNSDWSSFVGNPTKLLVGIFSLVFDIILTLQHYLYYRKTITMSLLTNSSNEEGNEDAVNGL